MKRVDLTRLHLYSVQTLSEGVRASPLQRPDPLLQPLELGIASQVTRFPSPPTRFPSLAIAFSSLSTGLCWSPPSLLGTGPNLRGKSYVPPATRFASPATRIAYRVTRFPCSATRLPSLAAAISSPPTRLSFGDLIPSRRRILSYDQATGFIFSSTGFLSPSYFTSLHRYVKSP